MLIGGRAVLKTNSNSWMIILLCTDAPSDGDKENQANSMKSRIKYNAHSLWFRTDKHIASLA